MVRTIVIAIGLVLSSAAWISCQQGGSQDMGVNPTQVTKEGLHWYSIEDLEKMKNLDGKLVMVDVYTSWCGWCKVMDKKTFTDPEVVKYLNDNFVAVKFNAEQKEPVQFKGESYEWIRAGRRGVNKLAMKLLNGRLGYPTIVYLDSDLNKIRSSPGYKTPEQLLNEIKNLPTSS